MCQQQATACPGHWDETEKVFVLLEGLEPILSLSQVTKSTSPIKLVPWKSLILALTLRQPVCLLSTPQHSFQCALFPFDLFSPFSFSTDITSWKKTSYPSTSLEQLSDKLSPEQLSDKSSLEQLSDKPSPGQLSDKPSPAAQ